MEPSPESQSEQALAVAFQHRKIGREHLALYRSWLQGLDLKVAGARYLPGSTDVRAVRSTLDWIQKSLTMAARRHGRPGLIRLLRLPLATLPDATRVAHPGPTLDDFRAAHDPEGFYSEQELTRLYLENFPEQADSGRARRYRALVERQLRALIWAEDLLTTAPRPEDPVSAWFDDTVAVRLLRADLHTVGDVTERIRAEGYRWWVRVPRIGEKGAVRIAAWLSHHPDTLGELGQRALKPVRALTATALERAPATGMLPLESLALPTVLDGSTGTNRFAGKCRIDAANDLLALQAWLATKARNPNTERAYRREAERLLLWCVLERGIALSSMSIDDATAYRDWMAALGRTEDTHWPYRLPQSNWLGRRGTPRWSASWRPFEDALSHRSLLHAHTILKSLFDWLVKVRYLDSNPWECVPALRAVEAMGTPELEQTRSLTQGQWQFLIAHLAQLPNTPANARFQFVLPFAYATGLRLSELVDARVGRLYSQPLKTTLGMRWMLKVLGKGGKWRAVPMPVPVMAALRTYLSTRGYDDLEDCPDDLPLIAGEYLPYGESLHPTTLYKSLKKLFESAADALENAGQSDDARRFRAASTHWIRHTRGSHAAQTMPINLVQRLLGHASLNTTTLYASADEEELYLACSETTLGPPANTLQA